MEVPILVYATRIKQGPVSNFGAKDFGSKDFGAKDFSSKDFSSKDFGAKPFGDDAATAIAGHIDNSMRDAAASTPGSFLAKVVSSANGYYTLETPDGKTLRRISSATRSTWPADYYVTVERTAEGVMQISAAGAAQSD